MKITPSLFYPISILFLILFISACAPKEPFAEAEKDPSVQNIELQDLKKTYLQYQNIDGIDIALFLKQNDVNKLINDSFLKFSQKFSELETAEFSDVSFGRMKLDYSQQSLYSRLSFSFEFNNKRQKVFGHIKAKHRFRAGKNRFILDSDFNEIVLDKVDGLDSTEEDEKNAKQISSSIKHFMHRLNIEIINRPLSIEVDMNILSGIDENSIYYADDYSPNWVQPIKMKTKMKSFVPYLSKKGVLFLGSSALKKEEAPFVAGGLEKISNILKEQIDNEISRKMGLSLDLVQKYSSYYISKKYMAQQMSKALEKIDLRVINKFCIQIDEADQNLSKNIYFFDKNSLPSCSGVKVDCKEKLSSCDKQCSLTYGIHRCAQCEDINNPFEKVRCLSKVEGCRSKEELHLYNCHKSENACIAKNSEAEKTCEIQNRQKVSICKEKKDELEFINDEIVLAKLNLNFTVSSSYVVQRLRRISFSESLDRVEVTRDMHLSMESKISVLMKQSRYKDLNCSFALQEPLLVHSEFDYVNQKRELSLLSQTLVDGRVMLKAISKPTFISTKLKNSPYQRLLENKNFALECRYQDMPMQVISSEELLKKKEIPYSLNPMLAEIELPFQEEELSFIISPVKLGPDILLFPTMDQKSISFSRQAHFY